ncbi:MAG: hypothetical protein QOK43_2127 [Acidimicrobiaceae bacterium]|nr:hypothetical protein [Acidimicrobiaceae bacterium]
MSTTKEHSADVPLAVWPLAPHGGPGDHETLRRELAWRVLDGYLPAGGAVLDIDPHDGEVPQAVLGTGGSAVVVAAPESGARLGAFDGTFDLAVALPPERVLREGGPWAPDEASLDQAAAAVRPGGFAVLCHVGRPIEGVAAAAAHQGLLYVQHVVVLLPPPAAGVGSGQRQVGHADVLVFAKEGA